MATPDFKATYRGSTTSLVAAASANAFFVIMGSATKRIRVQRFTISGGNLTVAENNAYVIKKISSAPTGGTASAFPKTPSDARNAAATVSLFQGYTAAPGLDGTLVGTLASQRVVLPVATSVHDPVTFDFRANGEAVPVTLNSTTEGVTISFGAAPATAVTVNISAEFTEEDP